VNEVIENVRLDIMPNKEYKERMDKKTKIWQLNALKEVDYKYQKANFRAI